jgi:hypothetical protein
MPCGLGANPSAHTPPPPPSGFARSPSARCAGEEPDCETQSGGSSPARRGRGPPERRWRGQRQARWIATLRRAPRRSGYRRRQTATRGYRDAAGTGFSRHYAPPARQYCECCHRLRCRVALQNREVEDVGANSVLPSEPQSVHLSAAKVGPQYNLRQRHRSPQAFGALEGQDRCPRACPLPSAGLAGRSTPARPSGSPASAASSPCRCRRRR